MGLSPCRESRVPCVVDVQVALGALFVSLRSLETTLFPGACQRRLSFSPLSGKPRMSAAVSEP